MLILKFGINWWVVNLGNVFVMRQKFLDKIEERKRDEENMR